MGNVFMEAMFVMQIRVVSLQIPYSCTYQMIGVAES